MKSEQQQAIFPAVQTGKEEQDTMEMTWENLSKLFTWAAKQGSDAPLADTAGETIVIDGTVTKEDFERFLKSQSGPR